MNSFPYAIMAERPDALERLDLRIGWGRYEIRVLRFHLTTFAPGRIISFHKHEEYEFHFIPRGKGRVILGEQPFQLEDGLFYLTGPGIMHYQEADTLEAMHELCLYVDIRERAGDEHTADPWEAAEAEQCMARLRELPLVPAEDVYDAMSCFLEAYQASVDNYAGSYTTIKQAVLQILLRAVRAFDTGKTQPALPSRDMSAIRYRLAMKYIHANYAGPLTLEDVAEKLHISSRQLQRIFKTSHDRRSFSTIVEDIRLEAVCRRLADSTLPIETIAVMEGFTGGSYLHTVFRKRMGMTPSEYRKTILHRNGEEHLKDE